MKMSNPTNIYIRPTALTSEKYAWHMNAKYGNMFKPILTPVAHAYFNLPKKEYKNEL